MKLYYTPGACSLADHIALHEANLSFECETLTENIAILDWIAHQKDSLTPGGPMGRVRLLEALGYISTEIHKSFTPFFAGGSDDEKVNASDKISKRMQYLSDTMQGEYLLGDSVSVADFYLFVMLLWAQKNYVGMPVRFADYQSRMMQLPSVVNAMEREGLI